MPNIAEFSELNQAIAFSFDSGRVSFLALNGLLPGLLEELLRLGEDIEPVRERNPFTPLDEFVCLAFASVFVWDDSLIYVDVVDPEGAMLWDFVCV